MLETSQLSVLPVWLGPEEGRAARGRTKEELGEGLGGGGRGSGARSSREDGRTGSGPRSLCTWRPAAHELSEL